jgi:hypothetical protein
LNPSSNGWLRARLVVRRISADLPVISASISAMRRTASSAIGDFVASHTSKNFRRAWAKQATCVTRGGCWPDDRYSASYPA